MCIFVVCRRKLTASTMFKNVLSIILIYGTLCLMSKNPGFRIKYAFSMFSDKHQPDFIICDFLCSLFTFIRASLDCWLWEWCSFLLRSSCDSIDVWSAVLPLVRGTLRSPTLRDLRGLLGLLIRLSSPVSSLTVWCFYFDLSVSHQTCCKS